MQPEFLTLVTWYLLAHYTFYATSHQATLSQIDWHAAFVGRTAYHDHNNFISAALVLLNTFGGAFLIFFLYPLVVMSPITLYSCFPSLIRKISSQSQQNGIASKLTESAAHRPVVVTRYRRMDSANEDIDVQQGELTLYENEDLFLSSIFKVGGQLLTLQGVRVSIQIGVEALKRNYNPMLSPSQVFSSMLACTIHCRHLMVWKIFAPRFIYEGITTYTCIAAVLLGYLLVVRTHKALRNLMVKMGDS